MKKESSQFQMTDAKTLSTHTVKTLILSFFFFSSDCFEDLLEGLDDDDDLLDEALLLWKKNKDIDNVSVSNGI